MQLTSVDLFFWAGGLVAHVTLLIVLGARHRITQFPLFTAMILGSVIRTGALYCAFRYGNKEQYGQIYWSLSFVDLALQLAVFFEVAWKTFRPLGRWAPDLRRGFRLLMAVCLTTAFGLTWLASPSTKTWIQMFIIKGDFFSAVLMCELFVGMIALSAVVGLPMKTHVARIVQGLGVYSLFDVVIEAGHSIFGLGYSTRVDVALSHARIATYLVCLVYWNITLWQEAPRPRELPREMLEQIAVWQKRLAQTLRHTQRLESR
ncbi:MAG: hypothetical protein ACRYFU_05945 [Janthinobacterium lividum]